MTVSRQWPQSYWERDQWLCPPKPKPDSKTDQRQSLSNQHQRHSNRECKESRRPGIGWPTLVREWQSLCNHPPLSRDRSKRKKKTKSSPVWSELKAEGDYLPAPHLLSLNKIKNNHHLIINFHTSSIPNPYLGATTLVVSRRRLSTTQGDSQGVLRLTAWGQAFVERCQLCWLTLGI